MYDPLTYFAWIALAVLFGLFVVTVIALGSLPRKIAIKRNHPQEQAINAASWIGLATGGVGWIIAFVWAFVRSNSSTSEPMTVDQAPDLAEESGSIDSMRAEVQTLRKRISEMERKLSSRETQES